MPSITDGLDEVLKGPRKARADALKAQYAAEVVNLEAVEISLEDRLADLDAQFSAQRAAVQEASSRQIEQLDDQLDLERDRVRADVARQSDQHNRAMDRLRSAYDVAQSKISAEPATATE